MMSTPTLGYMGKAWIGLMAAVSWTWEDGELATYFNWMLGQPHNQNSDECVTMLSGFWTEVSCSQTKASVCFDGAYKTTSFVVFVLVLQV